MHRRTALVIPALNEEQALEYLLAEIPSNLIRRIIVVDNGSTDATSIVARDMGVIVVQEPIRGYGRACWRGFQAAKELGADILVFMDGDGSDNPADLPAMLAPIINNEADFVMGSRVGPDAEAGAVPAQARLGNWLISRLLNLIYKTNLHDVGSFRALRTDVLDTLHMHEMTFGWPVEMLVKAARMHYRIVEVPLHYRQRRYGHSKVGGTIAGSVKAAYTMLRTLWRYIQERETYV
jgi:glycosyltransferase involved in cell wall biosynthesis